MITKVAGGCFYASVAILFSRHSPSLGYGPLGAEAGGGSSAPSWALAGGPYLWHCGEAGWPAPRGWEPPCLGASAGDEQWLAHS